MMPWWVTVVALLVGIPLGLWLGIFAVFAEDAVRR